MPLHDPYDLGAARPVPQGLWERAVLVSLSYQGDEGAIRQFLAPYGPPDQLVITHQPASWPPSWVLVRYGSAWEVAIAGTVNLKQILLHLGGVVGTQSRGGGSFVNSLHALIARDLWAEIKPIILAAGGADRIAFSGHSYGGAVAELLALDAVNDFGPDAVGVVTFGCPRWLAGPEISPGPLFRVRVSAEDDPVPRLPPRAATVAQIAQEFHVPVTRSYAAEWRHVGFLLRPVPPPDGVYIGQGGEEPGSVFGVRWISDESPHGIQSYCSRLQSLGGVGPLTVGQAGPVRQASDLPAAAPANVPLDKGAGIDLSATNRLYWRSDAGPITGTNIATWEAVSLAASAGGLLPPANIGHFLTGGLMSAKSGFAKVTMCINNGRFGHKESHIIQRDYNGVDVVTAARKLCDMRSALLGSAWATTFSGKSRKTPVIEYVVITDPLSYKLGALLDFSEQPFHGLTANEPADTFANALTVRMRARKTDAAPVPREFTSNLQLVGIPDDSIVNAAFDESFVFGARAFRAYVDDYVRHLMGVDNYQTQWGAMGLKRTEQLTSITGWALVGGVWTATTGAPHGYQPLDRIRIQRCDPVFNGTWKIATVTANTFTLRRQPVGGHTNPPPCTCIRVGFANGDRALEFYPYYDVAHAAGGGTAIRVSSHRPGREFVAQSFNKRTRRER